MIGKVGFLVFSFVRALTVVFRLAGSWAEAGDACQAIWTALLQFCNNDPFNVYVYGKFKYEVTVSLFADL